MWVKIFVKWGRGRGRALGYYAKSTMEVLSCIIISRLCSVFNHEEALLAKHTLLHHSRAEWVLSWGIILKQPNPRILALPKLFGFLLSFHLCCFKLQIMLQITFHSCYQFKLYYWFPWQNSSSNTLLKASRFLSFLVVKYFGAIHVTQVY